jgi:hypothetical protein
MTEKPRVLCPVCHKLYALAKPGYIHPHGPRGAPRCAGSWSQPPPPHERMDTPSGI